jgi:hypothetical protein
MKFILDYYGIDTQLMQTMEECAELIYVCSKVSRYGIDHVRLGGWPLKKKLIEDIADLEIMLNQLKIAYDIHQEVSITMRKKIDSIKNKILEEE